ncbi:putative site-specific DNA-methyltransferase [Hokovirus HKV1]|uniref:site-specific DNA-methyltransferase (adenine-specific) n=1 Tax=Hokovirus HKV1 TaxID=1977638 RepID=A0A1V0SF57_9VIRU|nr:putative site-specific DNA-methyltransferase [Hokovirus HKV1]
MLNDLEMYWQNKNNENIFTNENLTWYDPTAGMGNFPIAIYYKLMEGLKDKIKDDNLRKKHIIENQLYFGELNKKNCFIVKQIFNINNEYKLNLYNGNTLDINLNQVFKKNKFDIIIGNPPYNEELKKSGARPLYNKFIEYYIEKCNILSFVVPSRWFAGGKGLDKFRNMMINRNDIVYIKHYDDASKIFGNLVDIKGGVNYFLVNENYNGLCNYNGSNIQLNNYDVIVDSKYYGIINKISDYDKITKLYVSQDHYKIQTNDKRLVNENGTNYLKCYVSKQKGYVKYIDKKNINKETKHYKVITARASFCANSSFGNSFIGYPNEIHSKSYISFNLNSENEAKTLLSYLKCKLPNLLLSLRKSSQDISESTCKWIPIPEINNNLYKEWSDEEVYKYFKFSDDEIKIIKETKITGYNEIGQEKTKKSIQKQQNKRNKN